MTDGLRRVAPLVSPLPGASALDAAIDRHLVEFAAVPPAIRKAAWAVATIVMTLSPSGALQGVGFAHRVARREHG